MSALDVAGAESQFIDLPGLRMHVVTAGPEDGEAVLLLHGFPEFWYSWRHQIVALAEAGYRVIAPDQRGYNLTEKTKPYDVDTLLADLCNLLAHFEIEETHLVAHDWGGVLGWCFASEHGDKVISHVNMNGPHPNAYMRACVRDPRQFLKSWYVYFFQLPWLPEMAIRADDMRALDIALSDVPSYRMPADGTAKYKDAMNQPGAVSAMVGWYRAVLRKLFWVVTTGTKYTSDVPTLVIWGARDAYLSAACNDALPDYFSDVEIEYVARASHWIQMQEPEIVNARIIQFFGEFAE